MDNRQQILLLIEGIVNNLNVIASMLGSDNATDSEISEIAQEAQNVQQRQEDILDLEEDIPKINRNAMAKSVSQDELGPMPYIDDPNWPEASADFTIVKDDDVKMLNLRASQIAGIIGINPIGLTILDYGSYNGYLSRYYAKVAKSSLAYDIDQNAPIYKADQSVSSDDSYTAISKNQLESYVGRIDLLILFDVIDHVVGCSAQQLLIDIKRLLAPNGKVFLRCHPWTSRTGGHLYYDINKAFAHLALTPAELISLGIEETPNIRANKPLAVYEDLINKAGYTTASKKVHTNSVESYFDGPILDRIIKTTWAGQIPREKALRIMGTTYIDYILTVPSS